MHTGESETLIFVMKLTDHYSLALIGTDSKTHLKLEKCLKSWIDGWNCYFFSKT